MKAERALWRPAVAAGLCLILADPAGGEGHGAVVVGELDRESVEVGRKNEVVATLPAIRSGRASSHGPGTGRGPTPARICTVSTTRW